MSQILKIFCFLLLFISSNTLYTQNLVVDSVSNEKLDARFVLGTGFYSLSGNEIGLLKGNIGFNAGMQFAVLNNLDLSFMFFNTVFSEQEFSSEVDGMGINFCYTLDNTFRFSKISPFIMAEIQRIGFKTNDNDRQSTIAIPFGLGFRLNITERMDFDVALNFGLTMGDIDMDSENDNYQRLNFGISYDLFSPSPENKSYPEETYYADIDFISLDAEDEDGDLVPDIDDICHQTPKGVKVDKYGCPIDTDNDGIPDYIDKQKNTKEGSFVDEYGVQLTPEKYKSMYSASEAASREYADFYNDNEIKRENYKTIDEYLIAKANAFNKAYNNTKANDNLVESIKYKVKIGAYSTVMPENIQNQFLSLDDLESYAREDGVVEYVVGSYSKLDDAFDRELELESLGFDETSIVVYNKGMINEYIPPKKPDIDFDKEVVDTAIVTKNSINGEDILPAEKNTVINNQIVYRVQIGAFPNTLPKEVFVGVKNLIYMKDKKDNLIKYMTGSFTDIETAIDYMFQMRARGFKDAFVVANKGSEITIQYFAPVKKINNNQSSSENAKLVKKKELLELKQNNEENIFKYTVQILVDDNTMLDSKNLQKLIELGGDYQKDISGSDIYIYYAGTYNTLEEANIQLNKAVSVGFKNAFVFSTKNGERVPLK